MGDAALDLCNGWEVLHAVKSDPLLNRSGDDEFPERLLRLRVAQGLTQGDLARLCDGIPSEQTISNWERRIRKPRTGAAVQRVALALRTSVAYLLWGQED